MYHAQLNHRIIYLSAVAMLLIMFFSGCSNTARKIGRDITGYDSSRKKKVALTTFGNMTTIESNGLNEFLQREMIRKLSQACNGAVLIKPGTRGDLAFLSRPTLQRTGGLDAFALAENGRKNGINAIVVGTLISIKTTQSIKGLVFRKDQPMLQLDFQVALYDTETGAKLLDEVLKKRTIIDEVDYDSFDIKKLALTPVIEQMLIETVDDMGESICDAINRHPWKGYIIASDSQKIVLSSGRETGIVPGDVLAVFDSSVVLEGNNQRKYFLLGPRIGEIKIIAVFRDRSEAIPVSGENLKVGCVVMFER